MSTPAVIRGAVQARIAGHVLITGPPLRRLSVCLVCGLDSGPWLTRQAAEVSGLLHLTGHHPERCGAEYHEARWVPIWGGKPSLFREAQ